MGQVAHGLGFDWDNANIGHIARHQVTPEEAEQVILNEPVETDYRIVDGSSGSPPWGSPRAGVF